MLYTSAEYNKPKRVQGAFIGEKEVKKVVDFFKSQVGAVIYNEEILERPKRPLGISGLDGEEGGDSDPMLQEAIDEVKRAGKASASLLQRRLRVGYARAARLLDIMEQQGIIGPGEGVKPREVFGGIPPSEKTEYGIEEEDQTFNIPERDPEAPADGAGNPNFQSSQNKKCNHFLLFVIEFNLYVI